MFSWAPALEAQHSFLWLRSLDPWASVEPSIDPWPSWRPSWTWKRRRKKKKKKDMMKVERKIREDEVDKATKVITVKSCDVSSVSSEEVSGKQKLLMILRESKTSNSEVSPTNGVPAVVAGVGDVLQDEVRRSSVSTCKTIVLDVMEEDSGLGEDHSGLLDESSKSLTMDESWRLARKPRKCVTIKETTTEALGSVSNSCGVERVVVRRRWTCDRGSVDHQRRLVVHSAKHFVITHLDSDPRHSEYDNLVLQHIFHHNPIAVRMWLLKLHSVHVVSAIFTLLHRLLFADFWSSASSTSSSLLELSLHCTQSFLSLLSLHVAMEMDMGSVLSVMQDLNAMQTSVSIKTRLNRTRDAFLLLWTHLVTFE